MTTWRARDVKIKNVPGMLFFVPFVWGLMIKALTLHNNLN